MDKFDVVVWFTYGGSRSFRAKETFVTKGGYLVIKQVGGNTAYFNVSQIAGFQGPVE